MSKQQPQQSPTLYYLLSETTRIVSSNRRHFLILSLLLILPRSLFATIYSEWSFLHPKSPTTASTILTFVYSIISLLAVGSLSFSSYNFLLGRPIKPISSIQSLVQSFPRLLITYLASLLIIFPVMFAFGILGGLIMMIGLLVLKFDQPSQYLYLAYPVIIVVTVAMLVVCCYLVIIWGLANVVAVIESKRGFEALRRSAQLMKGNKRALASLLFLNGCVVMGFMYGFLYLMKQVDGDWKSLLFVLSIVVNTSVSAVLALVSVVAITVLYCKAAGEYVILPLVDDDVEKACKVDDP